MKSFPHFEFRGSLMAGAILLLAAAQTRAAAPSLDALLPSGARSGSQSTVTIVGKAEPWPCGVWCSHPGLEIIPVKETRNQLTISVPEETPPAAVLIRLHNGEGASEPRAFVIGALPEHNENPDHAHTLENPEPIATLPVTINGRLGKSEDVDIYRIALKAGDTLLARVDGYGLRSGIDPYLHLYDPDGVQIALGNDNGRNLDPQLVHEIEKPGDHLVAIMAYETPPGSDIRFTGSQTAVYRLTLTTDPEALPRSPPDPELQAALAPPFAFEATIARPGETDRYTFHATKNRTLIVRVRAHELGSRLDPVLTLAAAAGKKLQTVDDADKNTRDAEHLFKAPADGEFTVAVTDRFRQGSPEHRYRIEVTEPVPAFSATLDKSAYAIAPSKTVDLKLKLTRFHGHAAPLKIEIPNLPPGVAFEQPDIPGKSGNFTLTLKAAADAPPAGAAINVQLTETESEKPASQPVAFSFQDDNARGPYLVDEITDIWLTVKPST